MPENKQYVTQPQENGNVMISEDVIATIIAQAAKEVDGVVSLTVKPGVDISDMINVKNWVKGMKIIIDENDEIYIDCNINILYGYSVLKVATAVQDAIITALSAAASVKVGCVNVNVCGIVRQ